MFQCCCCTFSSFLLLSCVFIFAICSFFFFSFSFLHFFHSPESQDVENFSSISRETWRKFLFSSDLQTITARVSSWYRVDDAIRECWLFGLIWNQLQRVSRAFRVLSNTFFFLYTCVYFYTRYRFFSNVSSTQELHSKKKGDAEIRKKNTHTYKRTMMKQFHIPASLFTPFFFFYRLLIIHLCLVEEIQHDNKN